MKQPNVILVLTDDQGYGDLGFHDNPIVQTPAIDAFARESIRFTNYHVGPTCAPTRAGLYTGHYANSTGVWHTIGGRSLLRKDEWTIATAFADCGYATGLFGKWHLGDTRPYRPEDRGFQHVVSHGGGGISQTPDFWGNDYFDDTYRVNGEYRSFEGYCTDVWFNEAMKFIEAHRQQPLFCVLTPNAPHDPYNVDPAYSRPYEDAVPAPRARFYGMIQNLDENFGRLRRKLADLAIEEDTILIFMTDNGSSGGCRTDGNGVVIDGYNAGMRGQKCSPYEGGHRVPFFFHWPNGQLGPQRAIDALSANVDVMPTLLELCQIPFSPNQFHGRSLCPLLQGLDRWPDDRVVVTDSQRIANPEKWRLSCAMSQRWRLVNRSELYDMDNDPAQTRNRVDDYPDVVAWLSNAYNEWWETVSGRFDETIPHYVNEYPLQLNCHDWRNPQATAPWVQGEIREGIAQNGYWEIEVQKAGRYKIELFRWPPEMNYALQFHFHGADVPIFEAGIGPENHRFYKDGKPLPIAAANLCIGDNQWSAVAQPAQASVNFEVDLQHGSTLLSTAFLDNTGHEICGAYFVRISPFSVIP